MADPDYRIRGSLRGGAAIDSPPSRDVRLVAKGRLEPGIARDAGDEIQLAADDVARVELENGFVVWTRVDDLVRERGLPAASRGGGDGAWHIDPLPASARTSRGERGWVSIGIKILDFFGIDLAGNTAHALCAIAERRHLENRTPGLYRAPLTTPLTMTPAGSLEGAGQDPWLLFIHGTGSSTRGGFSALWTTADDTHVAARAALLKRYQDRVLAWDHPTLTQSPIQNALELAQALPRGAELHLVTHSRGGMVGELLCLGERDRVRDPFQEELVNELFAADRTVARQLGLSGLSDTAAAARDQAYADDRKRLVDLIGVLDDKRLKIRRFVRVACPAKGTTLASGRLDRWLSVLDKLTGNGLVAEGADFLLAVVKERTDPRTLPGLEAMMPGSALTRLFRHPQLTTQSDLAVIAGDVEGRGLWGQIKVFVSDWFYGADHDLVVNTGSMYGGIRRPEGRARFQFDQGPEVWHCNYFAKKESVGWLVAALLRTDAGDGGFQPISDAKQEEPRWRELVRKSRAASSPRPIAVVLPGVMGSSLKVDGERVWLHYPALVFNGLKKLRLGADVEPTDLLDDFYAPLLEFLSRTHRVEIFPYDWRLSVRDGARHLAARLETLLPAAESAHQPVHLVAHSMGGLVVRAMIADGDGDVWKRLCALPGSRLLMLGTPNLGSYEAMRWLTGHNPTQAKLTLLDLLQGTNDIIDTVRTFPGLLELLPFDDPSLDLSAPAFWSPLKPILGKDWHPADEAALQNAKSTWKLLRESPVDPEMMRYVAGSQPATVAGFELTAVGSSFPAAGQRLRYRAIAEGDGTVTWKSGLLPNVPTWYAEDTAHDELCLQKRAFPGYLDILTSGTTERLLAVPPAGPRRDVAAGATFPMPDRPASDDIPSARELGRMGLGPSRPIDLESVPAAPVVRVSIRHGDVVYSRHPVLVGHYWGDLIVSAERSLDGRLQEALSKRLSLGIYPGRVGTHAVFVSGEPHGKPGGVIVVGLGQVGELSPRTLEVGVRDALLDFALRVAQWPDARFGSSKAPRSAAVSAVLVGSGPGGVTVRESVEAVLRGAVAANARLSAAELDGQVQIDRVEFQELYESVALEAAEALETILADSSIAELVSWKERVVESGEGGQRRLGEDGPAGWWNRLEIIEDRGTCGLRFIASTDRARAEVTQATGQLTLAEGFIREASLSPQSNAEVAKTLFEMLLPNPLKELAPNQGDLVLLVDAASARYPWELLEDRRSATPRPPAVANGLVRQLKTPQFRPRPVHADARTAFVVGNPDLGGWQSVPDLPGARDEAKKVSTLLRASGYRVRDAIDARADQILTGLHHDDWRILHLAGHGVYEWSPPAEDAPLRKVGEEARCKPHPVSGMVIGDHTFLTPGDVNQMGCVPELVFINCCHLGRTSQHREGRFAALAGNVGIQFIEMGVKAVVAAGWAVDDGAATAFAERFYTHMLGGEAFGEAVRAAREHAWNRFPGINTWGAYQCYGDPGYRLFAADGSSGKRRSRRYHAPSEVVTDIENHVQWIRMQMKTRADGETEKVMRARIDAIVDGIPRNLREKWLARAEVAAALGFAWGELRDWAKAIEQLEAAQKAAKGDCPLRAAEQCANFRVRHAAERWANRTPGVAAGTSVLQAEVVAEIERAIGDLGVLVERGETGERLSLLGSACKRLAAIEDVPARRSEALVNMAGYYRRAFDRNRNDPYPFTNWIVAEVLRERLDSSRDRNWRDGLARDCQRMIDAARKRNADDPNFWDAVGEADCRLVQILTGLVEPHGAEREIIDIYRAAAARGASPREMASVLEHYDFLIAMWGAADDDIRNALIAIRKEIG